MIGVFNLVRIAASNRGHDLLLHRLPLEKLIHISSECRCVWRIVCNMHCFAFVCIHESMLLLVQGLTRRSRRHSMLVTFFKLMRYALIFYDPVRSWLIFYKPVRSTFTDWLQVFNRASGYSFFFPYLLPARPN